ncbi:MAG: hypothetical protein ACJ739_16445 [Acidimicrobiales bacterium]
MVLMGVCGLLLTGAVVLALRWIDLPFASPPVIDAPSAGEVARRFAWYSSLVLTAGIAAGVAVIGAGGRLAMRLLAATSGDDAQGRITEADEVVGEITSEGTIGFILFNGIFGGVTAAAVYLVLRRLLPPRWVGGLAFGAGLLVVLGTTVDPLRDENPDFDLVGPGWLSVAVFTVLALVFGVVLAAFMAKASAWLPLPSTNRGVLLHYLPIGVVALVGFTVTVALAVVGVVVVIVTRWTAVACWVRSRMAVLIGRAALGAVVVLSVPGAVQSVVDIIDG